MLMASLAGCVHDSKPDLEKTGGPPRVKGDPTAVKAWMASNPCGVLSIRRPLVNVSGHFTAVSNTSSRQLFLYLATNHSYDAVLRTVNHCRYLARTQISGDGGFQFLNLPIGNYSVLYRQSPGEPVQGFPVIDEQNASSHKVEMLWHGGDQNHALGVFSIQARVE